MKVKVIDIDEISRDSTFEDTINEFIKEEKTNENWYARFFKRIPNLLYLVFTTLWIIISLFMNMF